MSHILHDDADTEQEIGEPVVVKVFRFDPAVDQEPRWQEYTVPYRRRMSVFTVLREIYENQDPTLAFRNQQCGRGVCGTCQFRIGAEGKVVKGCRVVLEPGTRVTIAPYNEKKVIRDLVVDF